jgi:hypothetical protein
MKIRISYIIAVILTISFIIFIFVKYINIEKYYSKITVDYKRPLIGLNQIVNIDDYKVKYLMSIYYDKKVIGFNAIVEGQYITVTKLGQVKRDFEISEVFKQPLNDNIFALQHSDIEDQISRFIDFTSFPFKIDNIQYYTDGKQLKSYDVNFKEIVFNASSIDISFNNNLLKRKFGYVSLKQTMSLSFINYQNNLYIINTHPLEKNSFKSLHDLAR